MGPFDGLIASTAARHRIKLVTSCGLEKLLVHELSSITKGCDVFSGGRSFIEANVDLYNLWRIMLKSRICEQLWVHLCEPFHVKHARTFARVLNNSEWRGFIPFDANLQMPYIKVNTNKSSLYHTGMIKKLVHQVIKAHCHKSLQLQGDDMPKILRRRGHLPLCPSLIVNIDHDTCEVLANASGDITEKPWNETSKVNPRIRPSMIAAIAYKLEILEFLRAGGISTIWDPLCHIGTMLMELHSILTGQRLRPVDHTYPLNNFPLNCKQTADDAFNSFSEDDKTPGISVTLLGSDVFQENVKEAIAILHRYKEFQNINRHRISTPVSEIDTSNDSNIEDHTSKNEVFLNFSLSPLEEVQIDPKSTLILTNLYYGDKGHRKEFLTAHRRFEKFLLGSPRELLQNVYVVATENFRKHSSFIWHQILQFNNSGVVVMLLKLSELKKAKL